MSELPRRTSRPLLGQPERQRVEAGTTINDAGAAAHAAGTGTTPDRPVPMLGAQDIETIAARVAELLDRPPHRLLKVDEVAALLAVDAAFVYSHQQELGVVRLPTRGRRGALRFDRDAVLELLRRRAAPREPSSPMRRAKPPRPRTRAGVELLPYEPRSAA